MTGLRETADHAELARLAEAATPGPWKGRQPPYSEGSTYIEAELPCINGLSAWFSVALVPAPSAEEAGYSDDAIDSGSNAAFIAAASPSTVLELLSEIAALRDERDEAIRLLERGQTRCSDFEHWKTVKAFLANQGAEPAPVKKERAWVCPQDNTPCPPECDSDDRRHCASVACKEQPA